MPIVHSLFLSEINSDFFVLFEMILIFIYQAKTKEGRGKNNNDQVKRKTKTTKGCKSYEL